VGRSKNTRATFVFSKKPSKQDRDLWSSGYQQRNTNTQATFVSSKETHIHIK
jgi:hypothetical protein